MNERPYSLLLGYAAIIWSGGGMNFLVIDSGWTASKGYLVWIPILSIILWALFTVYRKESSPVRYRRAPYIKGVLALLYWAFAIRIIFRIISFISDGFHSAIVWVVLLVIVVVAATKALAHSLRDFRT